MHVGNTLKCTTRCILKADPVLVPVYLSKVYLTNSYMRLWVIMVDVPYLAFLIPKNHPADTQLIGFHIALPMGYIYSANFFCSTTNTSTDMANNTI